MENAILKKTAAASLFVSLAMSGTPGGFISEGEVRAAELPVKLESGRLPNIVLINIDDMGYSDIQPFGSTLNNTPNLTKMASEGIKFTTCYAAPVCTPSRASMMTASYAPRVGLGRSIDFGVLRPGDNVGINSDELTMAELLKQKDYATAIIGKWHLGDQPEFWPTRHGFDSFFGLPYSNDQRKNGTPLPLMENERVIEWEPDQTKITQRYTERAVQFMDENKDRPFFLYFPHMYVHGPLNPDSESLQRSKNGAMGAEVETVDWSVGVILDKIKSLNLDEETMVIFTSDNGGVTKLGSTNAPLRGEKASTWEGGVTVPLIIRWPGQIKANTKSGEFVGQIDFMPTFAYLTGQEMPTDRVIDGKNIWPLIAGVSGAKTPHETWYYYRQNDLEAVRKGDWKLHLAPPEKANRLYNLKDDIGETADLYSKQPDIVNDLKSVAGEARKDAGDERLKITGANVRPPGRVSNSMFLNQRFDENGNAIGAGIPAPTASAPPAAAPIPMPGIPNDGEIHVVIDGVLRSYDQPPVLINGRTLVPLRGIFETLGASVQWDGSTQTVTASLGASTVKLIIGQRTAFINGTPKLMDQEGILMNDRTMVPVRFVSEALGCDVNWDGASSTVIINSGRGSSAAVNPPSADKPSEGMQQSVYFDGEPWDTNIERQTILQPGEIFREEFRYVEPGQLPSGWTAGSSSASAGVVELDSADDGKALMISKPGGDMYTIEVPFPKVERETVTVETRVMFDGLAGVRQVAVLNPGGVEVQRVGFNTAIFAGQPNGKFEQIADRFQSFQWYTMRFTINLSSKTTSIQMNNVTKSGIKMFVDSESASGIRFIMQAEAAGKMYVDYVKVSK